MGRALLVVLPLITACPGVCFDHVTCFRRVPDAGCQVSEPKCCSGGLVCPIPLNPTYDNHKSDGCEVVPNNDGCG